MPKLTQTHERKSNEFVACVAQLMMTANVNIFFFFVVIGFHSLSNYSCVCVMPLQPEDVNNFPFRCVIGMSIHTEVLHRNSPHEMTRMLSL